MINKEAPFPQANDFSKVLKIINIDDSNNLKNNDYMSVYLGDITQRQVSYYLSATDYLGITLKREFTNCGNKIRNLSSKKQLVEIFKILMSDEIFSTIYFTEKTYSMKLEIEDVIDIMKTYVVLSSDEMYKRRGQTIMAWIKWANVVLNESPSINCNETAMEEIGRLLESAGCTEIETNHLLAKFLEQEAFDYVEVMNILNDAKKNDVLEIINKNPSLIKEIESKINEIKLR